MWRLSYVCLLSLPPAVVPQTSELRGWIRSAASDKLGNNCCHSQMRGTTTSVEYAPLTLDDGRTTKDGKQHADGVCKRTRKSFVKRGERADCDSVRIKRASAANVFQLVSVIISAADIYVRDLRGTSILTCTIRHQRASSLRDVKFYDSRRKTREILPRVIELNSLPI